MKQSLRSNLFFVHSRSSLIRSHTAEVAERRHLFPSVATVTSLAAEDFISLHPRAARFSRRCLAQLRQTDDAYFESLQQNDRPLCTVMTSRTDVRTHDIDTGQMFTRVLCLFVRCVEILYSIVGNIYTTNCNSRYVFRGKNIPLNQCLEWLCLDICSTCYVWTKMVSAEYEKSGPGLCDLRRWVLWRDLVNRVSCC